MMKFSEYLTWDRDKLLARLCELTEELANVHVELGYTRASEFSIKRDAWLSPRESSISGRIEDVKYSAATETTSAFELDARFHSLMEEKFLILRLLDRPYNGS